MEQRILALENALTEMEGHYALALAVVEGASGYVNATDGDLDQHLAILKDALQSFDSYEGALNVDAIAGDRVAVSVPAPEDLPDFNVVTVRSPARLRIVGGGE